MPACRLKQRPNLPGPGHLWTFAFGIFAVESLLGWGAAEESAVPFARDLHPEFGYFSSAPRVLRRLRLVLSFAVLGILGGASGVTVFMASPDSDPVTSASPLNAMALAPAEALTAPKLGLPPAQPATRPPNAPVAEKTDVGSTKRLRPLRAVNEQPLIAAAPIGHRNDPTMLPASPSARVEDSQPPAAPPEMSRAFPGPTETAVAEATPADAAPAAELTPPASMPNVTPKHPRQQVHHAGGRNHYSYTGSQNSYTGRQTARVSEYRYFRGGYASLW
jgi:hypothetical protein